jgi:hypothetical protein
MLTLIAIIDYEFSRHCQNWLISSKWLKPSVVPAVPRDVDELREPLKLKEEENEQEATHIEDTQRG